MPLQKVKFAKMLGGLKSAVEKCIVVSFLAASDFSHPVPFSSVFDFVVGFRAASLDPQLYQRAISHIIENICIDKANGI